MLVVQEGNGMSLRQSSIVSCYTVSINPVVQFKTRYYSSRLNPEIEIVAILMRIPDAFTQNLPLRSAQLRAR
jgi:hypothetical protein